LADCLDRIRPWERQIFLLSLAIGGNPHLAEKIASETTSRAFSQRHHLDTPDALSASLIRLTIKTGEELAKFDRDDPGIEAPKSSAVDGALAYLGPDGQMTRKAVATAWLTRPQCARLVIVLRDTLHFSTSEIAGILDIPAATVRQLLSSARLGILQLLAPSHFVNTATAIA
jgi:DNA-directed RNA polymerase specialized sigma24 family protein